MNEPVYFLHHTEQCMESFYCSVDNKVCIACGNLTRRGDYMLVVPNRNSRGEKPVCTNCVERYGDALLIMEALAQ